MPGSQHENDAKLKSVVVFQTLHQTRNNNNISTSVEKTESNEKSDAYTSNENGTAFQLNGYIINEVQKVIENCELKENLALFLWLNVRKLFKIDWSVRVSGREQVIMLGKCVSGQGSNDDVSTSNENLAQVREISFLIKFAWKKTQ